MQPGPVALSYICFGHVTYMFTLGIYTGSGSKPDTCQRSNLDLKPGLRKPPQDVVEPGLNADYVRRSEWFGRSISLKCRFYQPKV